MATVQLRRYLLPADRIQQDEWIQWWKELTAPRQHFGFSILFAYLDRESGEFTWAVAHDGEDFDDAEARYNESAERLAVIGRPHPTVSLGRVSRVEVIA
ncbi:MAG: hypothetical protein ACRDTS_07805 [Mycobacterium sp.]